jgi:hypothetical protein
MATTYPLCEAQRIITTLLTEQAAQPPPKRTARKIAEERWGLRPTSKEKSNA